MVKSYGELTIGQYDAIRVVLNSERSDSDKDIEILSILSGRGIDDILGCSPSEVSDMLDSARFLSSPAVVDSVSEFSYGGYKFRTKGMLDITYGQLVDIENSQGYVGLLRCILVPIGHKYNDGYDIDFSGLGFEIAKGVIDPFISGLMDSTCRTVKSTLRRLRVRMMFKRQTLTSISSLLRSMQSLLSSMRYQI